MFLLHGNVFDVVVCDGRTWSLVDFLTEVLLKESRDAIAVYNLSTGTRFTRRAPGTAGVEDLLLGSEKQHALPALERFLIGSTKTALIVEYAEAVAPAGDPTFQADAD